MAYRDGRDGIGGWLLFFLIEYCALWPLVGIASYVFTFFLSPAARFVRSVPPLSNAMILTTAVVGAEILIAWFVAYRLIRHHNPRSIRLTIAMLWLVGPIGWMVNNFGWMALTAGAYSRRGVLWTAVPTAIEIMIHAGLWTLYFLRSRRVRNTYYPQRVEDELAGTFA